MLHLQTLFDNALTIGAFFAMLGLVALLLLRAERAERRRAAAITPGVIRRRKVMTLLWLVSRRTPKLTYRPAEREDA